MCMYLTFNEETIGKSYVTEPLSASVKRVNKIKLGNMYPEAVQGNRYRRKRGEYCHM